MDSKQESNWAMSCHLSALAGFIVPAFGNILGPLIIWLIKKGEFPKVDVEGKKSLNFQISMTIYSLFAWLLCFIFIGFLLLPAIVIFSLIMVINNAVKVSKGQETNYPFSLQLIK